VKWFRPRHGKRIVQMLFNDARYKLKRPAIERIITITYNILDLGLYVEEDRGSNFTKVD